MFNKIDNLEKFVNLIEKTYIDKLFFGDFYQNKQIALKNLKLLHTTYSKNRDNLSKFLLNLDQAKAYAIYYGLINSLKVFSLLNKINLSIKPKSILDFGCGPATASLASLYYYQSITNLDLIDKSKAMRECAQLSLFDFSLSKKINFYHSMTSATTFKNYDLIFAVNCLNELDKNFYSKTVLSFLTQLSLGGVLIIIEPATIEITRNLMELRNYLCAQKDFEKKYQIVYPCTHSNECKLLGMKDQWCHAEILFPQTETTQYIDKALKLNKHKISYSSLVLKKGSPNNYNSDYRIITAPKKNKTGCKSYICGDQYQGFVTLHKQSQNFFGKEFCKLKMHDVTVWIDGFLKN